MAYDLDKHEPVALYPAETVRAFSLDMLLALGAAPDEAEIVTEGLMTASLWWHPGQGQGLEKFFRYHRRISVGGIKPGANMSWIAEGPAFALLDGAKGFGYVAAYRAMERAVKLAKQSGVAMVGVRNSNHFGIAGYHALSAARRGCIGWAFTNAKAEMAPWGSARPVLGTNPWGIAIPRKSDFPIVLDIALTMSGKGMMRWYELIGQTMPIDWALTPDGRQTTDPAEAMDGPLLPIGQYKGYGLSLITDVLAGVMTGSLFGQSVFQDDDNYDVGHLMLAVNPEAFMPRAELEQRLEKLISEIKDAPPINPDQPVMLPGEIEHRRMQERLQNGVPLALDTVNRLRDLASELGVTCSLSIDHT